LHVPHDLDDTATATDNCAKNKLAGRRSRSRMLVEHKIVKFECATIGESEVFSLPVPLTTMRIGVCTS
jgi:hypothetical protein